MPERIAERVIRRARTSLPARGNRIEWDTDVVGFGVRITANGAISFVLRYVHKGREHRMTLGKYPDLSASSARDMAIGLRGDIARGNDPMAVRRHERQQPHFSALCDRYLREHADREKKASSAKEDRRLIERHIRPTFGQHRVTDLTRQDILKLKDRLHAVPYEANRAISLLSKIMNLAELWGLRPDGSNPCRHVKRFPEKPRLGSLTADHLGKLGTALLVAEATRVVHPSVVNLLRLLLLTGCRLSEIRTLEWAWVQWAEACIHFADSKTGEKYHRIGDGALQLLRGLHLKGRDKSRFVFPALSDPTQPMPTGTIARGWRRIRDKAGLQGKRIHDFRHTRGSWAAAAGANAFLVRDALSHKNVGTTDRYVQFGSDALRQLNNALDQQFLLALGQTSPGSPLLENELDGSHAEDGTHKASTDPAAADRVGEDRSV